MTDVHSPFTMHAKKTRDPKMIGLWKVGRTLGKGFSGHVRIARHSKTGQYAAIKIISKGSLGSRVSLNRLADEVEHNLLAVEREIVVMKLIDHPNIMKLYDVWETSTSLYLILEYVQGGELFDYLCNKGRRPTEEVVGYFQQIICAVDYCHRFNIAHRDLKLENILIDHDSNIKVADFGMATWQDNSRGKLLRTSCGSPHYAAPEIISGKPYDGSISDIWSCGIILYALLAAKLPFDDDDCPALLRKISIGRFDMPQDISPQAQDLISRMLTINNPAAMPSDPNMTTLAHPIGSRSAIDPDIFANLRTIWHGVPDAELVESLTSSERNWQKGIYHLLVRYRKKYLDIRQEEEEHLAAMLERRKSKQAQRKLRPSESMLPPRDGPPTPRRAKGRDRMPIATSEMSFVHVHLATYDTPGICLSAPSPDRQANANNPFTSSDGINLPALAAPDLEDAKIQVFFQQVANHLNVLQAKTGTASNSDGWEETGSSSGHSPPVLNVDIPYTPIKMRYEGLSSNHGNVTPQPGSPIDRSSPGTRPLTLRRKSRIPRPIITIDTGDKENALPITESDIIHRQSPLARHGMTMADNTHLQLLETPVVRRPSKLKKKRAPTNPPASPMFSEAGSSFNLPSPVCAQRRNWLDNVFKFRQATYSLLSLYDVHTTRSECRRMLMEMDMLVSLEDSEKLGLLKCRSNDVKDASNIMLGLKTVKFRVEMQWPTPQLCHDGYLVSLLFIHEKGPLEVFKAIFHELERTWTLGRHPSRPSSVSSRSTRSSINAAGYLDRQR
ncbi:kinase-like domain-containing protein [Flammula alnicola]|nr:kinase-like domain-containing protein [Flammula alnicola]